VEVGLSIGKMENLIGYNRNKILAATKMNLINIILILLTLVSNLSFGQVEKKIINGTEFKIITFEKNDTEQTEYIEIFRNNKKLLSHTISDFDGDCSSENIELGDYQIIDSSIIFYSYWASGDRMVKNIYPYGFRKQIYSVSDNGTLLLKESEIYIENYVDSWSAHEGMKYLKQDPNSQTEIKLLKDYITKVETMYSSNFVSGKSKIELEKYVRNKLKDRIIENTKYWNEVYGENCNM
jgi:hypothetical protein